MTRQICWPVAEEKAFCSRSSGVVRFLSPTYRIHLVSPALPLLLVYFQFQTLSGSLFFRHRSLFAAKTPVHCTVYCLPKVEHRT